MFDVLGKVSNAGFFMGKNKISSSHLIESLRPNQIKCKKWLVEEIANINMNWNKVLVLGSWNGILLYELLQEYCNVNWIDFVDIDPKCHRDRDIYFKVNNIPMNYSSIEMDATEFSDHESYDLIINTSCEHMKDIPAVYGPTYALQSNNYTAIKDQHINCVDSEKLLANKNKITNRLFEGSLKMPNYKRFMVIGYYR
jgi:hypothetical protein